MGIFRRLLKFAVSGEAPDAPALPENKRYREENLLFRNISNEINQVFWVDNLDKTESVLNVGNYEGLYGRSPARLADAPMDWLEAVHEEDRPYVESMLPLQTSGGFDVKYRVVHPDGTVKWLHDRAFPIHDENGAPRYRAGVAEDITQSVALEEQLRHDQKLKAMGVLTGGISHDFNNVLAIILGNLEIAALDPNSPETPELINKAISAAERGGALTHRLLAYSRQQALSPTTLDGRDVINGLEAMLKTSLGEQINLEVVSGGGMWKCFADRDELETVLLNLAFNARDAMSSGGNITVEVNNARLDDEYAANHEEVSSGQYVCFALSDNGVGMSDDVAAQAFDPYFTTKKKGHGSGLGLSMAYGFAKQSNGHIKIYSEPGIGTTVKLYLPRSDRPLTDEKTAGPAPQPSYLSKKRIIVVEDDADVRSVVVDHLASFGCLVDDSGSAADAIERISADPNYDLLLTDVILGGDMNGPELAKSVGQINPGIQVVYMSGYTENGIIHDGRLDAGITLLQKPFTRAHLFAVMVKALATDWSGADG